ncbi:MAG: hypothetical protein HY289_15485 [Planctomycetes bacterium]|nr:hypothetical protein [Planctomycetota bacterium]
MELDDIPDDETLLRHIPGGTLWQAPGPRITSANFQLRHDRGETGVSVTRLKFTAPERLMEVVGGGREKGSRVAAARVGDVRALGLVVLPMPLDHDVGHAEIQSGATSLDDHACRKRLALLFRFVEE